MSQQKSYPVQLRRPRDRQELRRRRPDLLTRATEEPLPFRWDISHPEALGSIREEDSTSGNLEEAETRYRTTYPGFLEALLACAAQTIALAGDADLVFVGRAPESLFDLLSGLLKETFWQEEGGRRLTLLRYSRGYTETSVARRAQPEVMTAFRIYLDTLGLSPKQLIVRERPVALTDLVCDGTTMNQLLLLIRGWAFEEGADCDAVLHKLRVVGILRRNDEEPPTPRWKQRRNFIRQSRCWSGYRREFPIEDLLERGAFRELAISSQLWDFLGNYQTKTTPSYSPDEWGTEEASRPCHSPYYHAGVRAARQLYEMGCSRAVREQFAALLSAEKVAVQEAWYRRLIVQVRNR